MPDFLSELGVMALGSRLRRLSDRLNASVARLYQREGLPFEPRWFPLHRLLAARGDLGVSEAAEALGLSQAALSQTARQMSEAGVITMGRDRRDARRRRMSLSAHGRDLGDRLEPVWQDLRAAAGQGLGEAGADLLAAIDGAEAAFDRSTLFERTREERRQRLLQAVEILPYSKSLQPAFEQLNREWIEQYFEMEAIDERVLADPEKHILATGGGIWFARLDGEIVGTVGLRREAADVFELTKMAVSEAARGREAGRRLVLEALAGARQRGAARVYLVTNTRMNAGVELYKSVGFRVTRRGSDPCYERGDLAMELSLD